MNTTPHLIIIQGYPGVGKSTLAKLLIDKFKLIHFERDIVSKTLYDSLNLTKDQWKDKYLSASFNLLFFFSKEVLIAGKDLLIDSSFNPKYDTTRILNLQEETKCRIFQIYLRSDPDIILKRHNARILSPEEHNKSHEMHFARLTVDKLNEIIYEGKREKLDIPCDYYELDTSDFSRVNYSELLNKVNLFLNERNK